MPIKPVWFILEMPLLLLLAACGTWNPLTPILPTPAPTASLAAPTSTVRLATSTPVFSSPILEDFPLQVGTTRVYSVTVEYGTFDKDSEYVLVHNSGVITQTISSSKQVTDSLILSLSYQQTPPDLVMSDNLDKEYMVKGNSLFIDRRETLQWPLEVGREWNPFGEKYNDVAPGWYVWEVTGKENVKTSNRMFTDCFQLHLLTQPDRSFFSFCRKVGIATYRYQHGGMGYSELWELQSVRIP